MRVAIVGAAGPEGANIARELGGRHDLVLLDRARGDGVAAADLTDPQALMIAFDDCAVVVNAAGPDVGATVRDAALAAGAEYVDPGELDRMGLR